MHGAQVAPARSCLAAGLGKAQARAELRSRGLHSLVVLLQLVGGEKVMEMKAFVVCCWFMANAQRANREKNNRENSVERRKVYLYSREILIYLEANANN